MLKSVHCRFLVVRGEFSHFRLSACALILFSVFGQQTARAQGDELQKALDEIVVTATGTPHTLKNVPVQTEVISRKQI